MSALDARTDGEIAAFTTSITNRVSADSILAYMLRRYVVLKKDVFTNKSRKKEHIMIRHECWWLAHKLTSLTDGAIARIFGDVDHSSVIYGVKTINKKIEADPEYALKLYLFKRDLLKEFAVQHNNNDLEIMRVELALAYPETYRKHLIEMLENIQKEEGEKDEEAS